MTKITIAQLYPRDMNLYGDWGNTLALKKRLEWRGFEVEIIDHNPGDSTDFSKVDIFVGRAPTISKQRRADANDLWYVSALRPLFPHA